MSFIDPPQTYLITNVEEVLKEHSADIILHRPHNKLVGLVRDHESEVSRGLQEQPEVQGSSVILLPYDAVHPDSVEVTMSELDQKHPETDHIDVAFTNAGTTLYFGPSLEATARTYMEHFRVSTVEILTLFEAILPLLQRANTADTQAKYIAISSAAGRNALMLSRGRTGSLPYELSKATLNHCVGRPRFEHPDIAFMILTPDANRTEFGGGKVDWSRIPHALSIKEVVPHMMNRIDEFEMTSDHAVIEFNDWQGDTTPW